MRESDVMEEATLTAQSSEATRQRIMDAALETLREDGIAGTSARSIARRGDFSQAAIFYHFGSVEQLLVRACTAASNTQVESYRPRANAATDLSDLVAIGRTLHADEHQAGSMGVLTQLMAGSAGNPELSQTVTDNFERWIALVEVALDNALDDHPLRDVLPRRQVAVGISAMFLGMELMDRGGLDDADPDQIFDALDTVAELIESLRSMPDFVVRRAAGRFPATDPAE